MSGATPKSGGKTAKNAALGAVAALILAAVAFFFLAPPPDRHGDQASEPQAQSSAVADSQENEAAAPKVAVTHETEDQAPSEEQATASPNAATPDEGAAVPSEPGEAAQPAAELSSAESPDAAPQDDPKTESAAPSGAEADEDAKAEVAAAAPADVSEAKPENLDATSDASDTSVSTPANPAQEAQTGKDAPENGAEAATETAGAADEPLAPVFDVVRVQRDGSGIVAGRAEPEAEVEILLEGEVVGAARAGADGAFAVVIETRPDAKSQEITARALVGGEAPVAKEDPVIIVAAADEDAAPIIVQPTEERLKLIQRPRRNPDGGVTLDAISYDAEGRVVFAGRSSAVGAVRLYLDNDLIAETALKDDGSWRTLAGARVEPGVYRLRVDHVNAEGEVISRMESPFQREKIDADDLGEDTFTVQTGDNLWRIAEGFYGEGARYTIIFAANDKDIRDPDLIYPGQIFTIPDARSQTE